MSHVLRQMLMSTSVAALMVSSGSADAYIVNGFSPPVVADFAGILNGGTEYYRVGGSDSTFDSMFTYTGASLKTMNALGWAAHNLLPQLSSWSSASNTTLTGGQTDPDAGSNAVQFQHTSTSAVLGNADTLVLNETYVFDLKVKLNSGTGFLRLSAGSVDVWYDPASSYARGTTDAGFLSSTVTDLGSSWYRITLRVEAQETSSGFYMFAADADGSTTETTSAVFHTYQVHAYRGSRVGMANDATSGGTYVATTTSAVAASDQALLAWAPHNLALYSRDGSNWTRAGTTTVNTNTTTDPEGTSLADEFVLNSGQAMTVAATGGYTIGVTCYQLTNATIVSGIEYTAEVYVKQGTTLDQVQLRLDTSGTLSGGTNYGNVRIDLTDGTTLGTLPSDYSVTDVGSGWWLLRVTFTSSSTSVNIGFWPWNSTQIASTAGTESYYFYGARIYRSDLAGMVDNPNTSNSHVPTTSAAVYQARRNHYRYNGSTYDNKGILLESEARTNICTHSNEIDNAAWTSTATDAVTITANQAVGSDGQMTLDEVAITDTTNENHGIWFPFSNENIYAISAEVKDNDTTYVFCTIRAASNNFATVVYNLSTGAVTQESVGASGGTIYDSGIEEVASGIYRIWMVAKQTATTTRLIAFGHSDSATPTIDVGSGMPSYSGTAGTSFYLGHVQIEDSGSTTVPIMPSSYIPTSGATATRAAETLTIAAANMSYSATAMSLQVQGEITYADTNNAGGANNINAGEANFLTWRSIGTTNNYIEHRLATASGTGQFRLFREDDDNNAANVDSGGSVFAPGVATPFNTASRHTATAMNGAVAGGALTENSSLTEMPTLATGDLRLGMTFNGSYGMFRQWDADIGDTGIESATS